MKSKPWLKERYHHGGEGFKEEFEVNTCKGVAAYIHHKTDIEAQVHKTERYLVVNWWTLGQMKTFKIELPGGVLYCLKEEDFKPLFEEMGGSIEGEQTIVLKVRGKSPKMEKLIRYLIEEANHFPHPDYEEYTTEIHMLKEAEVRVQ
jgi:hypothetical protein